MTLVANEALRVEQVPPPGAPWSAIEQFALTFDGYRAFDGAAARRLAEQYAKPRVVPKDLSELRGVLFFEQRSWRHVQDVPRGEALAYIHALLHGIRTELARRKASG